MTKITIGINDSIDVDLFIKIWETEINSMPNKAFSDNMKHLKFENQTYANWIKTWLAWNELGSEEDIDNNYGGTDETYIEFEDEQ